MAVGKGSMERASKAVAAPKTEPAKVEEVKIEAPKAETVKEKAPKTEVKKTTPKKKAVKKPAAVKDTAVIAATNEQVMEKIVYQSSSQMLDRDAKPNESFYVGDDMPIYFF